MNARQRLTTDSIRVALTGCNGAALRGRLLALLADYSVPLVPDAAQVIADELLVSLSAEDDLERTLAELDTLGGPMASYVAGLLWSEQGQADKALVSVDAAIRLSPIADPTALLQRARLRATCGDARAAADDLRFALSMRPPYSFYVKAERLLLKLAAKTADEMRRNVRIALVGGATTALLAPVIRAVCFRHRLGCEVYEGLHGNYRQEILATDSPLFQFRPDVVCVVPCAAELNLPPVGGTAIVEEAVLLLRQLWGHLHRQLKCHVVQVGYTVSSEGAWDALEDSLPDGRRRALREGNLQLSRELPGGVSYLDPACVADACGGVVWSAEEWRLARQYPAASALPAFAEHLVSHARAALGLASKVMVVDLDNTLWGGVIGEDLLAGIRIGPPTAEGEAYRDLQSYLKELQGRGVLLAVCSKNNRDDAVLPFEQHEGMVLHMNDFVAFAANWHDKPSNLRAMAKDLDLGLESFVFLDDNPMERELMRATLPQVLVPECGASPRTMLDSLRSGMYFPAVVITDEDLGRHTSYRGNRLRREAQQSAVSLESFLAGLEMVGEHGPVNEGCLKRVTQLINKTNQFNLTTRRYTEEQVAAMADSPEWWCRAFRLRDRYGDYGLVGVMLVRRGDAGAWEIDTWLMSCRVLGRQMENFMLSVLMAELKTRRSWTLVGRFVPSEKNDLVRDLLPRLGFRSSNGTFQLTSEDEWVLAAVPIALGTGSAVSG